MSSDDVSEKSIHVDGKKLQELESLRETIANWQSQRQRRQFIRRLWPLIENWNSGLPDLRNVFRREEVDLLLQDAVYCMGGKQRYRPGAGFIEFVARAGYKDEPELDKDSGEPVRNRTTAIHRASLRRLPNKIVVLRELFKIYDSYDHTDKYGLTHFHAACRHGLVDVVEKFLERGRNADYLGPGTRDSPLHLALRHDHRDMVAMLLRWRVNPNVVGNCRATPLHVVAKSCFDAADFAREFFEIYDGTEQKLLVDIRDEFGRTPLHLALQRKNRRMAKLLLRRGADPSLASKAGTTPLHIVCVNSYDDDGFRDEFFEIVERGQPRRTHRSARVMRRESRRGGTAGSIVRAQPLRGADRRQG
ncbi:ankyrin-1-like [Trichogramma pretiosum]|uniref:ankyrin-1-like n=1 Tax=Trichogramma pretiosum TaxID=7493 RepID=UPI000C71BCFF|nr:ankyrin-1-like [Trichogramma pretiosum]